MRTLTHRQLVPAPPAAVWEAWTTRDGITSFFSPDARVELKLGGAFEMLFMLDAPPGSQGAEGCRILSYLPERMLSFSWNAPPSIPSLRALGPTTWVVLTFTPEGDGTQIELTQLGYQAGADWDELYAYFDRAWGVVLKNLAERFAPAERAPA